ncbi:MAG: N-acetylmuramoyl-L-alanine amidase [Pseudomonadota bacterium]
MKIISKPSPNFDERHGVKPEFLIFHYTGMETAKTAIDRLTNQESKVSSHYTIDEDGTAYQHVDEEKRAWHAGVSAWQNVQNINSYSVGIELVNKGHEFGYHDFPSSQLDSLKELSLTIMKRHDILAENILGHSDIAPDRKQDPGERFPWQEFAKKGIGIWPSVSDEDMVKATSIDVFQALKDFGYYAQNQQNALIAFQRHFVPEVFDQQIVGQITSLTKARIYALLAGHLI